MNDLDFILVNKKNGKNTQKHKKRYWFCNWVIL